MNYEKVANAADQIYKKRKAVAVPLVQEELRVEGQGKSIGRYLARWAQERGMQSKDVSMGKSISHCMVYFKGKRPPISPLEVIRDAIEIGRE